MEIIQRKERKKISIIRRLIKYARLNPSIADLKARKDVKGLISALENKKFPAHAVIDALGELKDREAVIPLIRFLNDSTKNCYERIRPAVILGRIGGTQAIEPLRNIMEKDSDKVVQAYAAVGLWLLGSIDISVAYSFFIKNNVSLFYLSTLLRSNEKAEASKNIYKHLLSEINNKAGINKDIIRIALDIAGHSLLEAAEENIFNSEINQMLFVEILEQCTGKSERFELIESFCDKELVNSLNAESRLCILDILWRLIYRLESYGGKHVSQETMNKFYHYKPIWEWAIGFASNFSSDKDERVRKKAEEASNYWHKVGN